MPSKTAKKTELLAPALVSDSTASILPNLAKMDWPEFATSVGEDGVFRGF
jgi:hypothetical protein